LGIPVLVIATIVIPVGVVVGLPGGVLVGALSGLLVGLVMEFMPQTAEVHVAAGNVVVANSNDSAQIPRQQIRALLVPRFGLPSLKLSDGTEVKLKGFGGGLWQRPQLRELAAALQVPLVRKWVGQLQQTDDHDAWSAPTT
jgi:hypothetical protein